MHRRRTSLQFGMAFIALCLVVSLAGCSQKGEDTASPGQESGTSPLGPISAPAADQQTRTVAKPTVRLAGGNTGLPNPFKHSPRGPGMSKMQILYDTLLEKDEHGDIPWLAESWEVSKDGKTYTFHMRTNALWHDGQPLTAEDAAFTIGYYREHPPVVNDLLIGGSYIVTDAKALDEYTLQVTFDKVSPTYLTKIGGMRIIPKHIWEHVDDPIAFTGAGATIGSDPYKLDSYDPQQGAYRFIAFEDYWGPEPAAAAIEWIPVGDSVLAFQNGEIDLINAPADIVPSYRENPEFTVKTAHSFHSYRLMMNMDAVKALQDANVRKALVFGIDRQALVDKAARGAAMVSSQGYVLPVSPWYNKDIEQYPYDPDKAQELLGGATYTFSLLTDNSADGMKVAELIKLSLSQIGVTINVQSVESKTRDNAVNTGKYELLLINSGGMGGDPDYLRTIYGTGGTTIKGWSDPQIASILEAQSVELDPNKRKELVYEAQKLIADQVPMIMLHGALDNFVYRPAKYDHWMFRYDHSKCDHNKLSYVIRTESEQAGQTT